jgi:21S rRNA (uridine2791-2'-O)-methyltransferase
VAITRTKPNGRVLGVDIIPAQPPRGVSTIQGNFLDPEIQAYVREFVRDHNRGRARPPNEYNGDELDTTASETDTAPPNIPTDAKEGEHGNANERTVDVVLSDMMMNTSGVSFRDHAGSMVGNTILNWPPHALTETGPLPCGSPIQF